MLHECQDVLQQTLITPCVLLHTAHCAPFSDAHDYSNNLHIFTWNLIHSFSIFSQRLLTEMDGLTQQNTTGMTHITIFSTDETLK